MKIENFSMETKKLLKQRFFQSFGQVEGTAFIFPIIPKELNQEALKEQERLAISEWEYVNRVKSGRIKDDAEIFFTVKHTAIYCPHCCKEDDFFIWEVNQPYNRYTYAKIAQKYEKLKIPKSCPRCHARGIWLFPTNSRKITGAFKRFDFADLCNAGTIYRNPTPSKNIESKNIIFIRESFDNQGIEGARIQFHAEHDEENKRFDIIPKIMSVFEYYPNAQKKAWKKLKSGYKEYDMLTTFGITGNILSNDVELFFYGYRNVAEFITINEEFSQRTGLDILFSNYNRGSCTIGPNTLFLFYLYLLNEFPIIEPLIKVGNASFVINIIKDFATEGQCKKQIWLKKMRDYENLINQTTKASKALSLPRYIWDMLDKKQAAIKDYVSWTNIYERTRISMERFEKFIKSEFYIMTNFYDCIDRLSGILKYGYTPEQISKYYREQNKRREFGIQEFYYLIEDLLKMSEELEMEIPKYPGNLLETHDEVMDAYKAFENKEQDEKLALIAKHYSSYKTTSKYYDIVVPANTQDFVTEGINNNNCVAGYTRRVAKGECRIFFIRRIEDMQKSYITAECRKDGTLGQIFYRNNMRVSDKNEIAYAKAFCKFIISKGWEPSPKEIYKNS